ncbi:GTP-binding protein [Bacteroides caecigallinarum]|uniref:GTP-binding protein n=1 Tax=Bacteroides caecigallinarum TaxID=1411144 RepID=UPI001957E99E|nr:GTP-binding protein [Bacteroides caecigallinarum]MBM6864857.1 GTP-binding protein [Bacteroides caecigallinarum]
MNKVKDVPVLLLTGYLGSGKTTLVNKILSNKKGIRFAVIVNDIGEVNIDADLIQRQGVVGMNDDSLVALQNGCICCTLRTDLIEQIQGILKTEKFDYIVIEASGICEPESIADTICSIPQLGGAYTRYGIPRLDVVVTVVDALRMRDEFCCAESLTSKDLSEDDIENLLIHQIEFCNIVLLNKASEVSRDELETIHRIVKTLQPSAEIMECDYADIDLNRIISTSMFRYEQVAASAGWVQELGKQVSEEDTDEHCHHHHHEDCDCHHEGHHHHDGECSCGHHHHHESETEEYGISTLLYFRRAAFDMNRFDYFISARWPKNVIRAKGVCYFSDQPEMSYLFEQAGRQKQISEAGLWYATLPEADIKRLMEQEPGLMRDWDEKYGDRMQKIVFIGKDMDKEQLVKELDACLVKE